MSTGGTWLRPKYATSDHLFQAKASGARSACGNWELGSYHLSDRGRHCKLCQKRTAEATEATK